MRKILLAVLLLWMLAIPTSALELTAPEVPASGQKVMPRNTEEFGAGLLELTQAGAQLLQTELKDAGDLCGKILISGVLFTLIPVFSRKLVGFVPLAGCVSIASILLQNTGAMISFASDCLWELCEYGKLLCPVMTAALAAQGGIGSSSLLYLGTTVFISFLSMLVSRMMIPMVYLYLLFSVTHCALGEEFLKKLADTVKSTLIWLLKTLIVVFTTYMGITGVVSGTTDAAALKAAKITISSVVPVIGGILSDASESVLVSMGLVKNAAGVYGILAAAAVFLGPFLRLGVRYLLLKVTGALCSLFAEKQITVLVEQFAGAMGLLLAMVATGCIMVLISTVCFMKGMSG